MKDWIKAGLGVGIGYTVGKRIGECLVNGIAKVICDFNNEAFVIEAKNGNEFVQKYCKKHGLEYEECDDSERVMGFHM